MRSLKNVNADSFKNASIIARDYASQGKSVVFSGGGTDLLQQIKEGTETPDILINLKDIAGTNVIEHTNNELRIGALTTLSEISSDLQLRENYSVLAQAAESVGSPQIRNAGTLAGNVMQRPWCWYYRNGFNCYKAGGNQCFSIVGENQLHAVFGGGPSFIVHPSDTAPALVALDSKFSVIDSTGETEIRAEDFFVLPSENPNRENILDRDQLLTGFTIPKLSSNTRSSYMKVMDRNAWTHALVSAAIVVELVEGVCTKARIVLGGVAPIPWRLFEVENLLIGNRIDSELAQSAGIAAIQGAVPLEKNGYKLTMIDAVVRRSLINLSA